MSGLEIRHKRTSENVGPLLSTQGSSELMNIDKLQIHN